MRDGTPKGWGGIIHGNGIDVIFQDRSNWSLDSIAGERNRATNTPIVWYDYDLARKAMDHGGTVGTDASRIIFAMNSPWFTWTLRFHACSSYLVRACTSIMSILLAFASFSSEQSKPFFLWRCYCQPLLMLVTSVRQRAIINKLSYGSNIRHGLDALDPTWLLPAPA